MIVKVKKITFVGLAEQKEHFIDRLQEVGVTHISLPMGAAEPTEVARELQRVTEIRKFLARLGGGAKPPGADPQDHGTLVLRREELGQRETRLKGEIAVLRKEKAVLEPWGDFDPRDIALLQSKGLRVGFYRVSRKAFDELDRSTFYCHVSRETEKEVFFTAISFCPVDLGIPEEKLPAKGLSQIDAEIALKKGELDEIATEYKTLAEKIQTLIAAEENLRDDLEYRRVLLNTESALEGRLFVLNCWSPLPEEQLAKELGSEFKLWHFSEDPEEGEAVPVLLANKSFIESGEDLVRIYSHPKYSDFDPSGLVLYCFAVFYGMIIGDAGYGFVSLGLTMLLHWKIKTDSALWIRFRRLMYMVSFSVIFFGIISASYFGVSLDADNPLNKIMLLNLATPEGQNQAMLISIIMGMIHISVALALKFYRTREIPSLGWLIIIWSGYALLTSKMAHGVNNPIATYILIAGFTLVVLFTSNSRNPFIRILLGLNGSLGVIQLFADVLSYMRLFALGLATMYMCQTFNMLAGMPYKGLPYVGVVPAVLILIAGHAINLLLGIMGGVVHGLRLNFLEWYRWCYEGDGLVFKPFRKVAHE